MILAGALILRLLFIAVLQPNSFYFSDARHYDKAAVSLLSGGGLGEKYNRSPLYPVLMAGVYGVFGHSFTAMRIFEAALGVLLCLLVFQIARRLFAFNVALIAAALAAVHPHFLLIVGILYPTQVFTVLMAAAVFLFLLYEEKKQRRFLLLSALASALAALTTPAMFFILPFTLLWMMFRPASSIWARVADVVIFLLVFSAVLSPWTIHNYQKYGRLTLVRPVPHTVFPNLADSEAQQKRIESGFKDTTDYLKANPTGTDADRLDKIIGNYFKHPMQSVRYLVGELGHFWALYPDRLDTPSASYQQQVHNKDARMATTRSSLWTLAKYLSIVVMAPLFFFALVGLAASLPWQRAAYLLLGALFGLSIGYSLIYAEVRYRIPIEPYVLIFTAFGINWIFMKIMNWRNLRRTPSVQVSSQ
jgi:hypothetical protein